MRNIAIGIVATLLLTNIPSNYKSNQEGTQRFAHENVSKKENEQFSCGINDPYIQTNISYDMSLLKCQLNDNVFLYNNIDDDIYYLDESMFNSSNIIFSKLITEPLKYKALADSTLNQADGIVEILERNSSQLVKTYYPISNDREKEFLSSSQKASVYQIKQINHSLAIETSYLSNLYKTSKNTKSEEGPQRIVPLETNGDETNNQALLDHYIQTAANDFSYSFPHSAEGGEDDDIVHLIPRELFMTSGSSYNIGSEWGYYINTFPSYQGKTSQVLVFDIDSTKMDQENHDVVSISVSFTENYKYYDNFNYITALGSNNLCLANPAYSTAIAYSRIPGNIKNVDHPNPGDPNYSNLLDNGYTFSECISRYIGQKSIYGANPTTFSNIVSFIGKTFQTAYNLATLTLDPSNIIDFVLDLIWDFATPFFDNIMDQNTATLTPKISDPSILNGKYFYMFDSYQDGQNYNWIRNEDRLCKIFATRFPGANNSIDSSTIDRTNPLLFKEEDDTITYSTTILNSENDDSYTAYITHAIQLDIFDDTTSAFHQNVDYLTTIKGEFGYYIGEDVKNTDLTFSNDCHNRIPCYFGSLDDQFITFVPKVSGEYDIVALDYQCFFQMEVYINDNLLRLINTGEVSRTIISNIAVNESNQVPKFNIYLAAGFTYTIRLKRFTDHNDRLFGSCNLTITLLDEAMSSIDISSYSSLWESHIDLPYNGVACRTSFSPLNLSYYILSTETLGDTYISTDLELCDENYNIILKSVRGFKGFEGGMEVLLAPTKHYILKAWDSNGVMDNYSASNFRISAIKTEIINDDTRQTYSSSIGSQRLQGSNSFLFCFNHNRLVTVSMGNFIPNLSITLSLYTNTQYVSYDYPHPFTTDYHIECRANTYYILKVNALNNLQFSMQCINYTVANL